MVHRLAGSDAGFLFIESPSMTSTCLDVALLAPPADGRPGVTLDDLRAHIDDHLDELPSWRWRLESVPFGLHHPVWIEDPDFDLDLHLSHVTLPAPGGEADLDALIVDLLPTLLDRRHPLWHITLVDGLQDGGQALIFRFHHSLADGAALLTTLDRLFAPRAGAPEDPRTVTERRRSRRRTWRPQPPSRGRLFVDALRAQLRAWFGAFGLLRITLARFKAVEERRALDVAPVPKAMGDAPPTVLNRSADDRRVYARTRLAVTDLQAARRGSMATLNDVVLAVVAGGLRSHVAAHGGLPDRPLVVNVPVSGDPPGAPPRQWGNQFANFFASLATDVDDPVDRLAAIAASTAEGKLQLDLQGRDTLPNWLDRLPPAIAEPAARAMARRSARHPDKADFSVLVSNVRVTSTTWQLGDQAVEHIYMAGPVADGAGLNVTVTGYGADLHLALVANPAAVPDPRTLVAGFHASLRELLDAVAATEAVPLPTAEAS